MVRKHLDIHSLNKAQWAPPERKTSNVLLAAIFLQESNLNAKIRTLQPRGTRRGLYDAPWVGS